MMDLTEFFEIFTGKILARKYYLKNKLKKFYKINNVKI